MARRIRLVVPLLALALSGLGAPAVAQDTDESNNMELLSTVSRETAVFQSDLAFWGDRAYAGNYDGFRIFDISDPANPDLISSNFCRGPQNDVSVWQNQLLFLSIDSPQVGPSHLPRGACTADAEDREIASNFEGIRIFDVSDPTDPKFVKGVDTDCGSHTHTLVPDTENDRLLIYVSSYPLRVGPICGPHTSGRDGDVNRLHSQISIVEVPLDAPHNARVIREEPLAHPVYNLSQVNPELTGFFDSVGCHDINVFRELDLAAAACMSNGQLWDISDPANPKTLPSEGAKYVDISAVEFWHSAAFTQDGRLITFGDESILGSCGHPNELDGRLWFYERSHFARPVGSFLIPRPQVGSSFENRPYCSAHLFNPVPGIDRYILAASWYQGGTDVIDFTDPANAKELGFYDAAREDAPFEDILGTWSSYWYNGFIPSNDIERGFEVFRFTGHETDGATELGHLNPQTQEGLEPAATTAQAARFRSVRVARARQRKLSDRQARSIRRNLRRTIAP